MPAIETELEELRSSSQARANASRQFKILASKRRLGTATAAELRQFDDIADAGYLLIAEDRADEPGIPIKEVRRRFGL